MNQTLLLHEEKFRVYNDALVHAAECQKSKCEAHNGHCHKVKASINHFVRCFGPRRQSSPIERCVVRRLHGYFSSVLSCTSLQLRRRCAVSQCDYLRDKITRKRQNDGRELQEAKVKVQIKLEEWPVERRIAQVETDGQQVLQLIADIRAGKTKVVQAQQQPTRSLR